MKSLNILQSLNVRNKKKYIYIYNNIGLKYDKVSIKFELE